MTNKISLRQHFIKNRQQFVSRQCGLALSEKLGGFLATVLPKEPGVCASYLHYGAEADPSGVEGKASEWKFAYPVVQGEGLGFRVPKVKDEWNVNQWGIREPKLESSEEQKLQECSVVFVPGLAFDQAGRRLGHGQGFYDRALANYQGFRVGVAYSVQVSETDLPSEDHDIPVDVVVTEKFILRPQA